MIYFSNKQCSESVDITLIPILTTGKTFLEFYNRNFNIQLPNTYVYAGFFLLNGNMIQKFACMYLLKELCILKKKMVGQLSGTN